MYSIIKLVGAKCHLLTHKLVHLQLQLLDFPCQILNVTFDSFNYFICSLRPRDLDRPNSLILEFREWCIHVIGACPLMANGCVDKHSFRDTAVT